MKKPSVCRLLAPGGPAVIAVGTGATVLHAAPLSHKQGRLVFSEEFDGEPLTRFALSSKLSTGNQQ